MQRNPRVPGRSAARSHKRVYARLRRAMAKWCAADPEPLRAVAVPDQRCTATRCFALHRIRDTSDRAARVHHAARQQPSLVRRGGGPAHHFVDGKGRGEDLAMLVGVPRSDLHNRKTGQVTSATVLAEHQSSKTTPMPARILGRLWRVPVLGLAVKESLSSAVVRTSEGDQRKAETCYATRFAERDASERGCQSAEMPAALMSGPHFAISCSTSACK